jgi:hypothetical protein
MKTLAMKEMEKIEGGAEVCGFWDTISCAWTVYTNNIISFGDSLLICQTSCVYAVTAPANVKEN